MTPWLDFGAVIAIQFAYMLVIARYTKTTRSVFRKLHLCLLLGIPFGILFDFVVGNYFGMFDYRLGFGIGFLIINGALSYGLMMTNLITHTDAPPHTLYLWTVGIGVVYEIGNYFFPVWSWTFLEDARLEEFLLIFILYPGLALLMMLALSLTRIALFASLRSFISVK